MDKSPKMRKQIDKQGKQSAWGQAVSLLRFEMAAIGHHPI